MKSFSLWRSIMMFFGGMFIAIGIPLLPYWSGLAAVGFFMVLFGPMLIIFSLLKTKEIKPKKNLIDEKYGAPF